MCKDPIFLAFLLVLITGYPSMTTSSYSHLNPRRFLTDTKGNSIAQGSSPAPSPGSGLDSGAGKLGVHISPPVSGPHFEWQFPYTATVNPMQGVYLLCGTAVIVGGIWACCKFGKSGRRVDRLPYQELEMGQTDVVSANDEETAEGWDENWDDDWDDEIREVKSPSRKAAGNNTSSADGMTSKSAASTDRNGWKDH